MGVRKEEKLLISGRKEKKTLEEDREKIYQTDYWKLVSLRGPTKLEVTSIYERENEGKGKLQKEQKEKQ